jgi:glycine/D-amino acid oxidase-like deaminating enzyme
MPLRDPSQVGREINDAELSHVHGLVRRYIPALGPRIRSKACMYMLTPDEHFILDRHPIMRGVYFLAGLSGHGFKFAPVLGEALANLALDGRQEIDVKFFSLKRF